MKNYTLNKVIHRAGDNAVFYRGAASSDDLIAFGINEGSVSLVDGDSTIFSNIIDVYKRQTYWIGISCVILSARQSIFLIMLLK